MAGIDVEFIEKPPKAVQSHCPICLLVLREPHQATCCGKSFCKECIEQVKTSSKTCPTCKEREFGLFHNKGLQQSLYDFEVYCSQKSKGCEWRGELRELEKHLNSEPAADKSLEGCPFTVVKCPLSHTGCEVKLPRRDMKDHVNSDLLSHLLKQTALVQDVSERLQIVQGEKQYLEKRVSELEDKVKMLERTQDRVAFHAGKPIGPIEFIVSNFEQCKNDKSVYLSPFYTHPHGYKMCLCVYPNGFAGGTGTHLGVTIHLMRGEFDNHLKWPFRGEITFMLVDQEGEDHVVGAIPFDNTISECITKRVVTGERNNNGRGSTKMIALSNLQPKYLKNDCLKLNITKMELTH